MLGVECSNHSVPTIFFNDLAQPNPLGFFISKKLLPHLLPQIFLTNVHLQWVFSPVVAGSIRSANGYRLIELSASFRLRERNVPTPGMPMIEPATFTLKWPTSDHESCVCFVCAGQGLAVTGFGSGADRGYQTSS